MNDEERARRRMHYVKPVKVNAAQTEFAEMVGRDNIDPVEAAKKCWPRHSRPNQKAREALESPGVKIMIRKFQLESVNIHATATAYRVWDQIANDPNETGSARNKAAENLHNYFGFGKMKDEKGDPLPLEDMSPAEVKEFIAETERQLKLEQQKQDEDDGVIEGEFTEERESIDDIFPKNDID